MTHLSWLLQEYEGLTTKIHELQQREEELQDMLISEQASPTPSPTPPEPGPPPQWGDVEPLTLTPNSSTGNLQLNATGGPVMLAMQQSQGSPLLGPKSMRNVVKVRLPNDQKTAVGGCLLSSWCASVLNAGLDKIKIFSNKSDFFY